MFQIGAKWIPSGSLVSSYGWRLAFWAVGAPQADSERLSGSWPFLGIWFSQSSPPAPPPPPSSPCGGRGRCQPPDWAGKTKTWAQNQVSGAACQSPLTRDPEGVYTRSPVKGTMRHKVRSFYHWSHTHEAGVHLGNHQNQGTSYILFMSEGVADLDHHTHTHMPAFFVFFPVEGQSSKLFFSRRKWPRHLDTILLVPICIRFLWCLDSFGGFGAWASLFNPATHSTFRRESKNGPPGYVKDSWLSD